MHQALEPYIESYGVILEAGYPIAEPARLALARGCTFIFLRKGLRGVALSEAVGIQMGYLVLGFAGQRRPFNPELEDIERKLAEKWAAQAMIPDAILPLAIERAWTPAHLARVCGTTEQLAHLRLRDALMAASRRPPEPAPAWPPVGP